MRKFAGLLIILMLITMVGGCSSPSEKVAEELTEKALEEQMGEDAKVEIDGENISIETEDGTELSISTNNDLEIPEGYPEDIIPFYEPQAVYFTFKNGEEWSIGYTSKKDLDDVVNYYEDYLSKYNGLSNLGADDQQMFSFNDNGCYGTVAIMENVFEETEVEGKTNISIIVGKP